MSEENRPNLNAVGLMVDVMNAIHNRRRGTAAGASEEEIYELLVTTITNFVEEVDGILDMHYPHG